MKAWENFNKKIGNNEAVGIYHETYQLKSGEYESIYGNMPQYGLGKALNHIPLLLNKILLVNDLDRREIISLNPSQNFRHDKKRTFDLKKIKGSVFNLRSGLYDVLSIYEYIRFIS